MSHGKKHGLWENIRLRRASGKPMRKKGDRGAPTDAAIKASAKASKKKRKTRKA